MDVFLHKNSLSSSQALCVWVVLSIFLLALILLNLHAGKSQGAMSSDVGMVRLTVTLKNRGSIPWVALRVALSCLALMAKLFRLRLSAVMRLHDINVSYGYYHNGKKQCEQ